jgi:hypothetical protein
MDDEQRKLTENQGRNQGRTALTQALYRALDSSYPGTDAETLAIHAAHLLRENAVTFDHGGSLRVANEAAVTEHAPRLLALNGQIVGNGDNAKLARSYRREIELEPLKPPPVVRTTQRSLTEALTIVAQMPARTDLEKCARAHAREQVLQQYATSDDGSAA